MGGGGNCAVDTEVSKQSNVGRDETMVGSSKVVVSHNYTSRPQELALLIVLSVAQHPPFETL